MAKRPGLSIRQLQQQIFDCEGFRVSFERLGASRDELAPYGFAVMAPQSWKVSDWKRKRLGAYLLAFSGVTVYAGDDTPIKSDVKLGRLRDTYYLPAYGTLDPADTTDNVVELSDRSVRNPVP